MAAVLIWLQKNTTAAGPETSVALVVLMSVVVLVLSMGTLTVVFKRLGLGDPRAAMGIPEGSIRAVIALILILPFMVLSVFLFSQLESGIASGQRRVNQVSAAVADSVPLDEVISRVRNGGTDAAPLFDLVLAPATRPAVDDFVKQLLTTMATLVVAVSAFYFGANSVTSAHRRATESPTRAISKPTEGTEQPASEEAV